MEDCLLVACREIQKTRLVTKTIAHRATHVSSAIVAFVKIDMKLCRVQNFGVLRRKLTEVGHFKILRTPAGRKYEARPSYIFILLLRFMVQRY